MNSLHQHLDVDLGEDTLEEGYYVVGGDRQVEKVTVPLFPWSFYSESERRRVAISSWQNPSGSSRDQGTVVQ